ncbi:MAG: lysophospholipid acyltransferase family protein, partial [Ruthenibacterium sp.]
AGGKSMIVFPEGTRSKGGPMGEFKSGGFKMACKAKAPIVPVVIDGSYKIMEANGNWMRPAHVNITILPPIATAALTREEQKALPQKVAQMIAEYL